MTTFNSRKITVTLLVLFAGLCFWQALPANVSRDAASSLSPSATAEVGPTPDRLKTIATQPIETIRVGQRVLAHNPEVDRSERLAWGPEPDFSRWLHLTLEMPKEDGSTLTIQMLRPDEWVESQLSYVIDEAAQSSRHAPRDEAERDQTAEIENHRRNEPASQIPSSATSTITAKSSVDQSGNTAMPHHAERDGYVVDAPLSPLRPVFRNILFTSLAAEEAGVELIGMTVQMDLPELGLTGEAIVTDIQPCSEIEPRAGAGDDRRVVTATFHHSSGDVIDLVLADEFSDITTPDLNPETQTPKPVGEADSIGTTSNHPFWSVDRQEYVQAGQLQVGERLQTLHGDTKTVVRNLPRPGPKTDVYNLEVHAEHVYFVGEDGVLVHNSKAYSEIAEGHAFGNVGRHLDVDGNVVSHLTRRGLAGDHVLPKQAIANAMAAAGVTAKSKAGRAILGLQDSAQNLRLMNSRLNSSKGARNAVEWMSTNLGSRMPRKYIQNILRKQYKNAVEINKHLNTGAGTKGIDYFSDFFGR